MGVAANTIARQCLEAGLLDEVVVDLVPIVMGKGGHTPASYLRITDSCWLTRRHSPGVSRQPAASVGSDVAYVASVLKMISGRILLVGNIFPLGRPRSRPAAGTIACRPQCCSPCGLNFCSDWATRSTSQVSGSAAKTDTSE